ncbi:hypothetical protein K474DRAFT_1710218 [Panus rudis PR-1116 ss-1]|nr:hypothetical protein K474DRAFT_1710218 [Panus rudis PR-1116 ss-1]
MGGRDAVALEWNGEVVLAEMRGHRGSKGVVYLLHQEKPLFPNIANSMQLKANIS